MNVTRSQIEININSNFIFFSLRQLTHSFENKEHITIINNKDMAINASNDHAQALFEPNGNGFIIIIIQKIIKNTFWRLLLFLSFLLNLNILN